MIMILLHQEWAGVSDPQQKPMPWVENGWKGDKLVSAPLRLTARSESIVGEYARGSWTRRVSVFHFSRELLQLGEVCGYLC